MMKPYFLVREIGWNHVNNARPFAEMQRDGRFLIGFIQVFSMGNGVRVYANIPFCLKLWDI
jgi:hypothetical protein